MNIETVLWMLLGIGLIVAAGVIRRRSLNRQRERPRPGLSPAQETQGAPSHATPERSREDA